jgi:MFS family permease
LGSRWTAERRAVSVVFAVFGADMGTFSSRLPWLAGRLHLSSGTLGLSVGLMMSIGALVAIPPAARLVHRYGPRASTRVLIAATGATLALPPFVPNTAVLCAVMLVTGAVYGTCDNAINAQGVEAELRAGTSIMSGLHGMWSIGVLTGALLGSLAALAHVAPQLQFTAMALIVGVSGASSTIWFAQPARDGDQTAPPRFNWPRGVILLIGLVGFAGIFVETAGNDWSAVFMRWIVGASQAQAALATATFAGSMALGRLCGDAVVRRAGPVATVRACGLLGIVGCLLVALSPDAGTALAGFLLIGLGVSVVVPLVFAAAGHSGPSPALGVAGVATVSYAAGLAAPSAIGGIATVSSLRVAFAVAALLAIAIAAGAGLLGRHPAPAIVMTDSAEPQSRSA